MTNTEQPQYRTVNKFNRMMGTLTNLPDVSHTKPATVVAQEPMIGATQTFIVQTFRQIDRDGDASKSRDTLFLQCADDDGLVRLVIPHQAIAAIIRQHEALTTKVRKKAGKAQAAQRKAKGIVPFQKKEA